MSSKVARPALILFLMVVTPGWAAEPRTEHTYRLAEGEPRPQASLDEAAWLAGSWTGTAFGKQFEAVWNPPSQGSMVGLFKLFDDQGIAFYELLLLTVDEAGSLSLKVKHFNPDFIAWEEKDDYVNFRLAKVAEDELHFSGMSFYRRSNDHIDGYIVMRNGEQVTEHHLLYQRR